MGASCNQSAMRVLNEFIERTRMIDLPLLGSKFTWSNMREVATMCRLGRVMVSPDIIVNLPSVSLQALPKSISDHNSIMVYVERFKSGSRPFKFFSHWMDDDRFNSLITDTLKKIKGSGIGFVIRKSREVMKGWVDRERRRNGKISSANLEK
ncbi:hypothetical protein V6N11_018755 [Hibiscus sabdariffa]|uniref:Uncharacterized protein n=2 Tax=Hibiscus sabdariffa TaxID=183260 RepID=A0ABR2QTA1_9ROSI